MRQKLDGGFGFEDIPSIKHAMPTIIAIKRRILNAKELTESLARNTHVIAAMKKLEQELHQIEDVNKKSRRTLNAAIAAIWSSITPTLKTFEWDYEFDRSEENFTTCLEKIVSYILLRKFERLDEFKIDVPPGTSLAVRYLCDVVQPHLDIDASPVKSLGLSSTDLPGVILCPSILRRTDTINPGTTQIGGYIDPTTLLDFLKTMIWVFIFLIVYVSFKGKKGKTIKRPLHVPRTPSEYYVSDIDNMGRGPYKTWE